MKKYVVFSRSISKYSYSENWSFEKQFDDRKYADMWMEIQQHGLKNENTDYCVAEFDLPAIPELVTNEAKIA